MIARLWQAPDALTAAGELSSLLGAISRRHARGLPAPERGLSRSRFAPVLEHIEAYLEQPQSLDTLAARVGLSRFHFVRAFGQTFHVPPHRYLQARRLARARQMLRTGEASPRWRPQSDCATRATSTAGSCASMAPRRAATNSKFVQAGA